MPKLTVKVALSYESFDAGGSNPNAASLRVRLLSEWCDCASLTEVFGEGGLLWDAVQQEQPASFASTQGAVLDDGTPAPVYLRTATFQTEIDVPDLNSPEQRTRLHQLNSSPAIYAVVLRQETKLLSPRGEGEGESGVPPREEVCLVPVSFALVDCSRFLLESGSASNRGQPVQNTLIEADEQEKAAPALSSKITPAAPVNVRLSVSCPDAFLSRESAIDLEPLFLNVSSLGGYPAMEVESVAEAVGSVYVYAKLQLGSVFSRVVYSCPELPSPPGGHASAEGGGEVEGLGEGEGGDLALSTAFANTSMSTDGGMKGPEHVPLDCRVCCLAGLTDIARFKESLTSSSFVLQVHRENLAKRSFHPRVCAEYHAILVGPKESPRGDAAAAAAAAAAAPAKPPAKGAPAPAAAAGSTNTAVLTQPSGPMTPADAFLLSSINRALETASQVRYHGTGRFRLEQLLKQSADLLKAFAKMRQGQGAWNKEEDVVVSDEILSEVRLAKPSKPSKWHRPSDISLMGALQRDAEERQSKLDGTLAVTGSMMGTGKGMGTGTLTTKNRSQPRHERFETSGTRLIISAELHRRLQPPEPEPRVFLKVVESFIKDGFTEKNTICDPETLERIQRRLAVTPFTRIVFAFKYDDDETLLAINRAILKVNKAALRDIQGSIRSYNFSPEELAACADGSLDVITGFMAIDDDLRLVVLEGLAAPGKGMQSVFMDIPKTKANDASLKILASPEILFPERLYGEFGPDLKRIRIRDKLKKLSRRPELYNRKQVEELCFSAIDCIMSLRRAVDLKSTKEVGMYPNADSLNKVELLYGEAVSRSDLDGTAAEADRAASKKAKKAAKEAREAEEREYNLRMYGSGAGDAAGGASSGAGTQKGSKGRGKKGMGMADSSASIDTTSAPLTFKLSRKKDFDPNAPRCAPTDCWNDDFEAYLAARPEHRFDFLEDNRELRRVAWENYLSRVAHREAESEDILERVLGKEAVAAANAQSGGRGVKIFTYASQAENFKVKAFSELRARIAQFSDATYTFSKDFISQTICVVDEDADKAKMAAEKKSHWLTQTGFTYPKPKTIRDLIEHPKRPSESRVEDLKEPWEQPIPGSLGPPGQTKAEDLRLERGYSVRVRGGDLFGALKPPSFERDFALSLVGDKSKLPRGLMLAGRDGDKDPAAFKSVHLGGEGQARIVEEALEKEKADWAAKVVVDNNTFVVGGFTTKEKVFQFERCNDILKDAPNRRELKALRNRKSVSGKIDYSYAPPPLSLLSSGPYVQNAAADALVRTAHPEKFVTAKFVDPSAPQGTLASRPKDFTRFIDRNANAPRIMCVLHKRSISPLRYEEEAVGAKWEGARGGGGGGGGVGDGGGYGGVGVGVGYGIGGIGGVGGGGGGGGGGVVVVAANKGGGFGPPDVPRLAMPMPVPVPVPVFQSAEPATHFD